MRDSEELLRTIHGALVGAGIDIDAVYERIFCSVDRMADPDRRSPHDLQRSFWAAVEAQSGDECIGLHLCPYLPRYKNPTLDYLFLSAGDFRQGVQAMIKYRHLISDACEIRLFENDDARPRVELTASNDSAGMLPHTEIIFAYGSIQLMQFYSGDTLQPLRVTLCCQQRDALSVYEEIFGCPVAFDAHVRHSTVWFAPAVFELQSAFADPMFHTLFRQHVESQLDVMGEQTLIDRIRNYLFRRLRDTQGLECTLQQLAEALDMSVRHLRTELAKADTSFRALIGGVRRDTVCHFLRHTHEEIEGIAERVGFADTSALYRAFGEWNHMTPGEYREQARQLGMAVKSPEQVVQELINLSTPASYDDEPE